MAILYIIIIIMAASYDMNWWIVFFSIFGITWEFSKACGRAIERLSKEDRKK